LKKHVIAHMLKYSACENCLIRINKKRCCKPEIGVWRNKC